MRLKSFPLLVLFMLIASVSFAANTIKIGFFAPLTGFAAADGTSAKRGAMLAVERINKSGGINGKQVKLIVYNDMAKSQEAVTIARELMSDNVAGVVSGSYSTPTRAAAPIYQRYKIPLVVAYATYPGITKVGNYIFRVGFLAKVEGEAGGFVAVKMLKAKRIAVLTMDNDFGEALSKGFTHEVKKDGGDIIANLSFALGTKDFNPLLTKLKGMNPDLIYATGYYSEGALIARQLKALGLKTQLLGQEGFDSPMFLKIAQNAANGTIITTDLNRDDKRPIARWFMREYITKYKIEPDMVGASSFDAVYLLSEAIRQAKSISHAKIRNAIAGIKNFNGVTGLIKGFNDIGEVTKAVQIQKVINGRFTYFGVVNNPSIITPPNK